MSDADKFIFPRDFPDQMYIDREGQERFVCLNGALAPDNYDLPSIHVARRDGNWYRIGKGEPGHSNGWGRNKYSWPVTLIDDSAWIAYLNEKFKGWSKANYLKWEQEA